MLRFNIEDIPSPLFIWLVCASETRQLLVQLSGELEERIKIATYEHHELLVD